MIGYYAHHQGAGHRQRLTTLAAHLPGPVTGLSSLPPPPGWDGPWVTLPLEGTPPTLDRADVTAGGRLHYAPLHDDGLLARTTAVSAWVERTRPAVLVVDVSVEVALLARLHGVPVVTVVLPGDRTDPAHRLVHDVAAARVALWPGHVHGVVDGVHDLQHVGALSRYDNRPTHPPDTHPGGHRIVTVLGGHGGHDLDHTRLRDLAQHTPGWTWHLLLPGSPDWVDDPWPLLLASDVVVTHAGQNALAEVAAARRPAVVIPQDRPHHEQATTARALAAAGDLPVVVAPIWPSTGWAELLDEAASLDGAAWSRWNDGGAAARFAAVVAEVAGGVR